MKTLQQYAALPWRRNPQLEILMITSRETQRWVIPKGWPMDGHSDPEVAAQEAYEEAGIRGTTNPLRVGTYTYFKFGKRRERTRCRVDVFSMEVTEVLDLWPEAHQRRRQWFAPQEAALHVQERELADIISAVGGDLSARDVPAPTYLQAILHRLRAMLRSWVRR